MVAHRPAGQAQLLELEPLAPPHGEIHHLDRIVDHDALMPAKLPAPVAPKFVSLGKWGSFENFEPAVNLVACRHVHRQPITDPC